MLKPPVPSSRQRAWSPLAISAAVHLLVLLIAAGASRQNPSAELKEHPDGESAEPQRHIDMIYMPPPEPKPVPPQPPAPPVRRPPPPPPPPPVRQATPEPEPNAPPEATRSKGETAEEGGGSPDPSPPRAPVGSPVPAEKKEAVTMESEARRIFGRSRLATRAGAGPQVTRPMEAWLPDNSERCTPQPSAPAEEAGPTEFGTVVGRIFRQDNGKPLAGAHLQMIGTPYVAFTDGSGEYRFRFALSLMQNCRTQYVKVTAAGYESRLLVLVLGPNRSEDVRLRRR